MTASTPTDLTAPTDPGVREFRHTYPWRGEEIGTIAFFALAPVALLAVFGGWRSVFAWLCVGAGLVMAGFLYHLHTSRVRRSSVSATLDGSALEVLGGPVGDRGSRGNLGDMAVVRVIRAHTIDPHLVFETKPNEFGTTLSVRLPMRLARLMAADLDPHLRRCRHTEEAAPYCREILALAETAHLEASA